MCYRAGLTMIQQPGGSASSTPPSLQLFQVHTRKRLFVAANLIVGNSLILALGTTRWRCITYGTVLRGLAINEEREKARSWRDLSPTFLDC